MMYVGFFLNEMYVSRFTRSFSDMSGTSGGSKTCTVK